MRCVCVRATLGCQASRGLPQCQVVVVVAAAAREAAPGPLWEPSESPAKCQSHGETPGTVPTMVPSHPPSISSPPRPSTHATHQTVTVITTPYLSPNPNVLNTSARKGSQVINLYKLPEVFYRSFTFVSCDAVFVPVSTVCFPSWHSGLVTVCIHEQSQGPELADKHHKRGFP